MKSHQISQNSIKKWSNHVIPVQLHECVDPEAAPVTADRDDESKWSVFVMRTLWPFTR